MRRIKYRTLGILLIVIIAAGFAPRRIDYRRGIRNNVCKELKGNVLVYYVFVDSDETIPWTEFDIRTTIDSMETAIRWLENEASKRGISLNIIQDYFIGKEYSTIKRDLPSGSVENSLNTPNLNRGTKSINEWADYIAKKVGYSIDINEKDGIPEIRNPNNKERLLAYLRDEKQVESVALIFMVNNYFKKDISVSLNTLTDNDVEFSVVSYKYPSVMVHNILHLFGAADLYKTVYRRQTHKIEFARETFPDDVMQNPNEINLKAMEIGELTEYLIGWRKEINPKYSPLLTDKVVNF